MSDKKNVKSDPLLGGDEGPAKTPEQKPETAKVEAKPAEPTIIKSTAEQVKADALTKFPKDIVAQTKYILDNSEHVNFIVPQMEGEIGEESVQINGYKLTIKKNVMVSIPIQVANILAEKYRIAMTAGQDKKIDRASDVADALS
jgi:hypothetical protein